MKDYVSSRKALELGDNSNGRSRRFSRRVNVSGTPDDNFEAVAKAEKLYYDNVFRPHNKKLIADVDSTELVDTAKNNADRRYDESQARSKRQRERLGVAETALDRTRNEYDSALAKGLNFDTLVNNSRVDQYERNVGLRNELVNTSRGIAKEATDGLSTAATLQTQRENNNESIKAQNKAARNQTAGQLAGMAMMAVMMM